MGSRVVALLLLLMLVVVALPVQAEDSYELKLNHLGLLSNISDAELSASLTRDVGMTMILKAIGYSQADADAAVSNGYFVDVDDWSQGWAELAYIKGITTGVGSNHFNPRGLMSEKEFVVFMLRALEYDTETSWDNAVMYGNQADIIASGDALLDARMTKKDAAEIMYKALSATLQVQNRPLINVLVEADLVPLVEAELQGLMPDAFELLTKVHNNTKEVTLTFSKSVNMATVSKETFLVYEGGDALTYDANVYNGTGSLAFGIEQVNGQTLKVIYGTDYNNSQTIQIDLLGIQSLDGEVLNTSFDYKVKDTLRPHVVEVKALNEALIQVIFSEPVEMKTGLSAYDEIQIDGLDTDGKINFAYDFASFQIVLDEDLDLGDHTIKLQDISDFKGKVINDYSTTITVVEDETLPTPVAAELVNKEQIHITFSESLDGTEGYVTIEGKDYYLKNHEVYGPEVLIELDKHVDEDAVFVECYEIMDLAGNVSPEEVLEILVVEDLKAPTVLVRGIDSEALLLVFSEAVQNVDENHVVVRNSSGNLVSVSNISSGDKDKGVYRINLADAMTANKAYYVELLGISDQSVNENDMAPTIVNIGLTDGYSPRVSLVNHLDNGKVRVNFSEKMNESFVGNLGFYYLYDSSETTTLNLLDLEGSSVVTGGNGAYVDLTIPGVESADQLMLAKVKDRFGNVLSTYGEYYAFQEVDVFGPSDITVELIEDQTIRLTSMFNEFDEIDRGDFRIRSNNEDYGYIYVKAVSFEEDNHSTALLKLNTYMQDDATYLDENQYIYTVNEGGTTDIYGTPLVINSSEAMQVEDSVAPEISTEEENDGIRIHFSEMAKAKNNTYVTEAIRLTDPDGDEVELKPGINLFYKGGQDFSYRGFDQLFIDGLEDEGTYYLTVYENYITDMNGNVNSGLSTMSFVID